MPVSNLLCLVGQYWHAHGCRCHFWLFLTTPPCRLQNMSPTAKKISKLVWQVHYCQSLHLCFQKLITMPLSILLWKRIFCGTSNFVYFKGWSIHKSKILMNFLLNVVILGIISHVKCVYLSLALPLQVHHTHVHNRPQVDKRLHHLYIRPGIVRRHIQLKYSNTSNVILPRSIATILLLWQ